MCALRAGNAADGDSGKKQRRVSIVVLGDAKSGTTSLIHSFRTSGFSWRTQITANIECFSHQVELPGCICTLELWDCGSLLPPNRALDETAERLMQTTAENIFTTADVVLVTFETAPTTSTLETIQWATRLVGTTGSRACVVKVQTKSDIAAENRVATAHHGDFMTSAKTGEGVYHLFETVVGQAVVSPIWNVRFHFKLFA